MKRGTTPIHTFTLPFDTDLVKTARVIYSQNNKVILTKTGNELEFEGNLIRTKLTQEDTLSFDCKKMVEVQLRVLTKVDEALASEIEIVSVDRCLENEVLT